MPLAKPKGFWSYARFDAVNAAGRMHALHSLMEHELGALLALGEKVDIFLDTSSIHTGEEWERMIRDRLAEADFMIAVLSPTFLGRPWCCKEVMLFREREKALGRSNLIFPVEYLDIADLRGPLKDRVADPKALELLEQRQIIGFSHLRRHDPTTSPAVGDFVEHLATEVKNRLLRHVAPPPPSPPPPVSRPAVIVPPPKPAPLPGTVIQEEPGPEMVLIPPGTFLMGVPEGESKREGTDDDNARPQHEVTIARPFWLGKYPVTRGEYATFAKATGRDWPKPTFEQDDWHPAVNVSHADAEAYLEWLSKETGQAYRMPSEAEWEYAARSGTPTARHWGEAAGAPGEHAHFSKTPGSAGGTCPVGGFPPNAFGLHDMLGNVWEWCADAWGNYKGAPADGAAWGAGECAAYRVVRGGSWHDDARVVRAALRSGVGPAGRYDYLGFRCVRVQAS